jgi:hypothetical protein
MSFTYNKLHRVFLSENVDITTRERAIEVVTAIGTAASAMIHGDLAKKFHMVSTKM